MRILKPSFIPVIFGVFLLTVTRFHAAPPEPDGVQDLVRSLKLSFSDSSSSVLFLEQNGRRYQIDVAARTIAEVSGARVGPPVAANAFASPSAAQTPASAGAQSPGAALFQANCARCHGPDGKGIASVGTPDFTAVGENQAKVVQTLHMGRPGKMPSFSGQLSDAQIDEIAQFVTGLAPQGSTPANDLKPGVYKPGDDVLFSLPTGRPVDKGAWLVNFSHRFPYDPAFVGANRGGVLFGLDESALPSFGLRYGVTDKLSVDIMRSPTFIGRPIQLQTAYNLLSEQNSAPFNLTARVSVEGQNDFRKNYTEDVEGIFSRSITHRAQFYAVPTISFNDRRVVQGSPNKIPNFPGINAFSIGFGAAVDIRPTVALVAEVTPTLIGGSQLGIHRAAFAFGIQKKIYRHAFTFGVTNSPGVTVSQRAGTDATFLNNPGADVFKEMFLGFDLTRQIH